MTTKAKKTAAKPAPDYDPETRYQVTLKRPIRLANRRLDPRFKHFLKGTLCEEHKEAIADAKAISL